MDARSLFAWYMDEGTLNDNKTITLRSSIISLEKYHNLLYILQRNFLLTGNIKQDGLFHSIEFDKINSEKILNLIKIYTPKSMIHKNPLATGEYVWKNNFKRSNICLIESMYYAGKQTTYGIEVAENQNFVANDIIVKSI